MFCVVDAQQMLRLSLMEVNDSGAFPSLGLRSGKLQDVTFIPSDVVAVGSPSCAAVLTDASRVAAWSEGVGFRRSNEAALVMDDAPLMFGRNTGSPSAAVATSVVSL
jgi:hypothetical protein